MLNDQLEAENELPGIARFTIHQRKVEEFNRLSVHAAFRAM